MANVKSIVNRFDLQSLCYFTIKHEHFKGCKVKIVFNVFYLSKCCAIGSLHECSRAICRINI